MKPSDFKEMIEKEEFQPFVIKTKGGRSYPVRHPSSIWLPMDDYDSVVCVAVRGKGITLLDIASIESMHMELDLAARS